MPEHVTVGLDGTRESLAAADWAADEAYSRGVPLELLQVREAGGLPRVPVADEELALDWAQKITGEVVDGLAQRFPEVRTAVRTVPGRPSHVLADTSASTDVLVLGSRGLTSIFGFIVGSTALPTVAHARCPVVLVRAPGQDDSTEIAADAGAGASEAMPEEGGLALGLDLRHSIDELADFAFRTARRRSLPLHILHAWELPPAYGSMEPYPAGRGVIDELAREKTSELDDALRPWTERFPDVAVTTGAVLMRPSSLLVDAASHASMLIVGRRVRPHSRLGMRLGPVTQAVMHHARCPVAVVAHE